MLQNFCQVYLLKVLINVFGNYNGWKTTRDMQDHDMQVVILPESGADVFVSGIFMQVHFQDIIKMLIGRDDENVGYVTNSI